MQSHNHPRPSHVWRVRWFLAAALVLLAACGGELDSALTRGAPTATRTPTFTPTALPSAVLAADIGAAETVIPLDDATRFPNTGAVRIDGETIFYSGKSGNSLTGAARGPEARPHGAGAAVEFVALRPTPSHTVTPPPSRTPSRTRTATAMHTDTPSPTQIHTATPSETATLSPTPAATATATDTVTATPASTASPSGTPTITATPTATPPVTATSAITNTPTPTPTPLLAAVCGNGSVEPPETCDDGNTNNGDACPSDCRIVLCATDGAQQVFSIGFSPPGGASVSSIAVLLVYPDGTVQIPGTGSSTAVSTRVTNRPSGFLFNVVDLDYALRTAIAGTRALAVGQLFRVNFDHCTDTPAAEASDFTCTVLEAVNPRNQPVSGVVCTVTVVD
jgi:cysteine-rich repeat protein